MVPRRVVLGEIISQIEFSWGPDEIELILADSVFHPPVAHVERLGEFLAHFGIENSLGGVVVGFKWGSGGRLLVAEFFESCQDGAGVFSTNKNSRRELKTKVTVINNFE